jgi:flagellar motility protein MotE (MotC chaperone)
MVKSAIFLLVIASIIPLALILYLKGCLPKTPQEQPSQVAALPDSVIQAMVADSLAAAEAREDSIRYAQELEYQEKEQTGIRLTTLRLELERNRQELEALKEDMDNLLKQAKTPPDSSIVRLVKLYEAMKPEKAALIMESLSDAMIVEMLPRMKRRQAARILSAIKDPKRGAALTRKMVEISYQ